MHINVRETIAAFRCLEAVIQQAKGPTLVLIGIDNTVAAEALRRSWSTDPACARTLTNIHAICCERGVVVVPPQVASAEQAADGPSQGLPINATRVAQCGRILDAHLRLLAGDPLPGSRHRQREL